MKRLFIIAIITVFIFLLALAWRLLYIRKDVNIAKKEEDNTKIAEVIEDDCTEEYEYEQNIGSLTANAEEEKISPNAIITYKKTFNGCKHEIVEQKIVSSNLVNITKDEFQEAYKDWKIEEFSPDKIIINKIFDGNCGEEFILRDKEGVVVIYKINEDNKEEEYEETNIATDYLTEEDKSNMKNGMKIIGKQELNKIIEDFE